MTAWQWGLIVAGATAAGGVNSVAGAGTVISFPILLWVGVEPVSASATNSVGLWPAGISGAWGFRRELARASPRMWLLTVPSLGGGLVGAVLLLHVPARGFEAAAPWLVLAASALLALREKVLNRLSIDGDRSRRWWLTASAAQLVIGAYGGFFGAGMGILMLATLGLLGLRDIHRMNGLKNLYAVAIKGAAVGWFAFAGPVRWWVAASMAASATVGALAGARLALHVGRQRTRTAVVAIGLVFSAALLARQIV